MPRNWVKALAHEGHGALHHIQYNPFGWAHFIRGLLRGGGVEISFFDYPYELVLTSKMVEVAKHTTSTCCMCVPSPCQRRRQRQAHPHRGWLGRARGHDPSWHRHHVARKDQSFKPVITHAINASDAVTTVPESLKRDTQTLFGVERAISVIPNFVCPTHFERPADLDFKPSFLRRAHPVHIGNFRPSNAFWMCRRVRASARGARGVAHGGDGPDRAKAESDARNLGFPTTWCSSARSKTPLNRCSSDLLLLLGDGELWHVA